MKFALEADMGGGYGAALVRAANAMLKTLGGDSVSLLLPATAMASDASGPLGLVDPGVQEVVISPAVMRELTTGNLGPRRRVEFTLPASVIGDQLSTLGLGSVDDLFKAVLGLSYGSDLFHIETVVPESFAGTVCFYVVTAVE
ncbi:MAG TPA: hypothetical protein VHW45_15170 [Candidatus Sulfotelmatobacter sp.]|nr:hypothetical protein [Candidatus Sulfotelmatobacter sp.]